jgi:hypothetical protein
MTCRSIDHSINDKRIFSKGKVGRISHLKGVTERLEFLKFVLSKSSLCLTESQTLLMWKALGEEAVTNETLDELVSWLDGMVAKNNKVLTSLLISLAQETDPADPLISSKLACLAPGYTRSGSLSVSSSSLVDYTPSALLGVTGAVDDPTSQSAFEEGVLVKLFEGCFLNWAIKIDNVEILSRFPVAMLCLKFFMLVNVSNKSIKVEADGSWVRTGPLSGMPLLWRMAMDSSNTQCANAATSLIIELHHRLPSQKNKSNDLIRGYILNVCFYQLAVAMQSLREGEVEVARLQNSSEVVGLTLDTSSSPKKPENIPNTSSHGVYDDWFDDENTLPNHSVTSRRVARLIMLLRLFIERSFFFSARLLTSMMIYCNLLVNIVKAKTNYFPMYINNNFFVYYP